MASESLVKRTSEEIATDLLKRRGTNISDTTIAIEVADVFQDLESLEADVFINLIRSYIKVADLHVSIPTWRIDADGRVKSDEELKREVLEF